MSEKIETNGKTSCCGSDNKIIWMILWAVIGVLIISQAYTMFKSDKSSEIGEIITPTTLMQEQTKAKVKILEFSDFKCPYCHRGANTMSELKKKYGTDIEIEFRQMPLAFHHGSELAAQASECARDQDKFWQYHDALFNAYFNDKEDIGESQVLRTLANKVGLNYKTFTTCLDQGHKKEKVRQDIVLGNSMGITGTPGFLVNDKLVVGAQPQEVFEKIIDEALAAS